MPITHPNLRIELLGNPVEQYAGLVQQQGHPTDCRVSEELLRAASQQYEQSSQQYVLPIEEKLDELFLEQARILEGFGGFGRTAHSLEKVRGSACVCMALGRLAWP